MDSLEKMIPTKVKPLDGGAHKVRGNVAAGTIEEKSATYSGALSEYHRESSY